MAARRIRISNEFFAKAKNDYHDWEWALIREYMQNSIDCGSTRIHIAINDVEGGTRLTVQNNGEPMSRDILENKLLALGSSGKDFSGTNVGGFGKAKEILYFVHKEYTIETGNLAVIGCGGEYDIEETSKFTSGTISSVLIEDTSAEAMINVVRTFCDMLEWTGGRITLISDTLEDNELLKGTCRKGKELKSFKFGSVHRAKGEACTMVVRMRGIPMFHERNEYKKDRLVLELNGKSAEVMSSNRDGLSYPHNAEMRKFSNELVVDKASALRETVEPTYETYSGSSAYASPSRENVAEMISDAVNGASRSGMVVETTEHEGRDINGCLADGRRSAICYEFTIKNETSMVIPEYYLMGKGASKATRKLATYWVRIMITLHEIFEKFEVFRTGFVFSDSCEAEHERRGHVHTYYLNPCSVVTQATSSSRSFRKRFKLTEHDRLIMIALHEFVHGRGYRWHDEDYSSALTDMAAVVMKNRKKFNWCFK